MSSPVVMMLAVRVYVFGEVTSETGDTSRDDAASLGDRSSAD